MLSKKKKPVYAKVQQHPVNILGIEYNVWSYVTLNQKSKNILTNVKKFSSQEPFVQFYLNLAQSLQGFKLVHMHDHTYFLREIIAECCMQGYFRPVNILN